MKSILDDYYTHEAILQRITYSKQDSNIIMIIKFCEWQLEEVKDKKDDSKGMKIIFKNVNNISETTIYTQFDEFILELKINKKNVYLILDNKDCTDIEFNYKGVEFELLFQ